MLNIFYGIIAGKDWYLYSALCNNKRHLCAAAAAETHCSLFAGCISLPFINLLPSITAIETPAQCLPLGHRQLQLAITQRWSWTKEEWWCHLSVAAIHSSGGNAGYSPRDKWGYCNYRWLLNYPRLLQALLPALPFFLCWGTRHQKQNLCFFWAGSTEFYLLQGVWLCRAGLELSGAQQPQAHSTFCFLRSKTLFDLAQSRARREPSRTQDLSDILQHWFVLLIMVCVACTMLVLPEKWFWWWVLINPALRSDRKQCSQSGHHRQICLILPSWTDAACFLF